MTEDKSIIKILPTDIQWFPTIGLKLTNKCALKCSFCCEPERNKHDKSLDEFKNVITKLWNNGTRRLCLTGGDPLLYENFLKLVEYSRKQGFYNLLLTATGKNLLEIIDLVPNLIHGIRFSIHGLNNEHDDIVHQVGAFDSIKYSINLLKKENVELFASTVVTNENIHNIEDIADWCKGIGIKKYYLYGLLNSGNGFEYIENKGKPSSKIFINLYNNLKEKFKNSSMEIKVYDYTENAECILVYGNGDILIDPHFNSPNYQLKIGNLVKENKEKIWDRFSSDPSNISGHERHLRNAL